MVRFMLAVILLNACVFAASADERPFSEQGFAGLTVRDTPFGAVVSWVSPGPLSGDGLTSPTLCRPDLIVAIDGKTINADQFDRYVHDQKPGTKVTIEYRRSNARGSNIPSVLDHREEVEKVEVILESREEWTGTIGRPRNHHFGGVSLSRTPLLDPSDPSNVLGSAVAENGLFGELTTLIAVFQQWYARDEDFSSLSMVGAAFEKPFWLPEIADRLTSTTIKDNSVSPAATLDDDPVNYAIHLISRAIDASGTEMRLVPLDPSNGATTAGREFATRLAMTQRRIRGAISMVPNDEAFVRDCLSLLRVPRGSFYLSGERTKSQLRVIRESMHVNWFELASALREWCRMDWSTQGDAEAKSWLSKEALSSQLGFHDPPASLVDAVQGRIIEAFEEPDVGWIVIGSTDNNRYDMAKIAAVIDPGGNDEYWASGLRLGTRVIIDLAGDDKYTGTVDQGPGGALLGVSLIDDRAGNDRYEGKMLSAGAAMFGVSLLLDRGGNDTYIGSDWSLGAAMYGAGMIIDLGDGADTYIGEFLCEGVGGPRGFGAIIDEGGNDLYRANGPQPSSYDTPAVYQSFSQGIGFGYRHYAAGGIGLINDLGGDDRYEAGEFAQGGAYYYGLGILHDAKGRDLYYGNRYGQGFGVHQAIGMLIDDEGDDTYWSMTAASQGAAWDIGVGMLLDRAGNDSYQCDGLGQGGASMQGIAMLIDLGGTDRYAAAIPAAGAGGVQGQSGDNSYHFHETGAYSFSLLMDLGAGADWYSAGRANNQTITTGAPNDAHPENSPLYGLFIDR